MNIRQLAYDNLKRVTPLSARRSLVRSRLRLRGLTASHRVLPDFVILGGQRCGTSSLYKYLGRHPEIAPSLRKEIEYFTVDYNRGEHWYRSHFPLSARRQLARMRGKSLLTFEATPDYLFDPRTPERVKQLIPDARFVVLLREPASRADSHYHHMKRHGLEELPLTEAIEAEAERLNGQWPTAKTDPADRLLPFRRHSYASRGLYADQLERWLEVFPRNQFLILGSDDLFDRPEETLHRILDFVGAKRWVPPEFRNFSYQSRKAEKPEIPPEVEQYLTEFFTEPNRELKELLQGELPWVKDNDGAPTL